MATYEYTTIIVNHTAGELLRDDGDEDGPVGWDTGYHNPARVFNLMGKEGWLLTSSVHEPLQGIGALTLYWFRRES